MLVEVETFGKALVCVEVKRMVSTSLVIDDIAAITSSDFLYPYWDLSSANLVAQANFNLSKWR